MESRLDELELRYIELQDLVQSLSEVVYGQQRELDLLRSELAVLKGKVAEPGVVEARGDEKPPHY
jgi:SlyX protein